MQTKSSFVVLGCAVVMACTLCVGEASARDRLLGITWGGAWGVQLTEYIDENPYSDAADNFAFDGNFEFRFFPANNISVDLNFDIGETIRLNEDMQQYQPYVSRRVGAFKAFGHFWIPTGEDQFFCVAPFIGIKGVSWAGYGSFNTFEVGSRIGGEFYAADALTIGFYGRPSFRVDRATVNYWGANLSESGVGFEAVFEMTFTIHLPVPRPE